LAYVGLTYYTRSVDAREQAIVRQQQNEYAQAR
jgi:hypothetical protein